MRNSIGTFDNTEHPKNQILPDFNSSAFQNKTMKKSFLGLLIIILATSLLSFKSGKKEWTEFKPENGNCSLIMPGEPTKQEKIVNTALGELKLTIFMFQPDEGTDDNVLYGLSYSEYPAEYINSDSSAPLIKTFFDNARDGAIKNIQGKLLTETIIKYKQYPGREQIVEIKDGIAILKFRHYLVKNRVYTMQVITLAKDNFNKSINKFLDSFKLTGE